MFKVGDRIECIRSSEGYFTAGKIYIVNAVHDEKVVVEEDDMGHVNGWSLENFRPCKPSPIQVVTRREIVPGVYGRFRINKVEGNPTVAIELRNISGDPSTYANLSASELREAAHIFNQLAEALEDEK